jgi:ubiquinone/menaquinone biosynthesis C-methylase UbiE
MPLRHERVCPWWIGYFLISPFRRLTQNPRSILAPFVKPGMTVLEPGPGMGFFTLDLARLVGPGGRVIAVDLQLKMLRALTRRAARAGLSDRIASRLADEHSLRIDDLADSIDFALAFAMVHELPAPERFFSEVRRALRPDGLVLLAEPRGHVSGKAFDATLALAVAAGLTVLPGPAIRRSLTAVLRKAEHV